MLKIVGSSRIGHLGSGRHDRVRRLHEEERRLAIRVEAHLACVLRIVAANAVNAPNREYFVAAVDRNDGLHRCRNSMTHGYNPQTWAARSSRHKPTFSCKERSEK